MATVLKRTANLNIKPYSNLLVEYETLKDVDKATLIEDLKFWRDLLNEVEKAPVNVDLPKGYVPLKECPECKSKNIATIGGKSKAGKDWFMSKCPDCKSSYWLRYDGTSSKAEDYKKPTDTPNSKTESYDAIQNNTNLEDIPF